MASRRGGRDAVELERMRRAFIARAALERLALKDTTQDLQIASDRVARIAVVGASLVRRYWLPISVLAFVGLFKRARPALRLARTGLMLWQTLRVLRSAR